MLVLFLVYKGQLYYKICLLCPLVSDTVFNNLKLVNPFATSTVLKVSETKT